MGSVGMFPCACECGRVLEVISDYDFRIRTSDRDGQVISVYLTVDDVKHLRKLMKQWLKSKEKEASGEN
jgi:hypothetical protein